MKFKKLLAVILAVVLSATLFACGGSELELAPYAGDTEQNVDADEIVEVLDDRMTPKYSYNEGDYSKSHVKKVREKLVEVLGIDKIEKNAEGVPLNVKITETKECDGYIRYHVVFDSEAGVTVPCYLLVPTTGEASYPLAITLHGHSDYGYHYAAGNREGYADKLPNPDLIEDEEEKAAALAYLKEVEDYEKVADFAVQAVKKGFIALAIEQRGMSDRTATSNPEGASMCEKAAQNELIYGRTLIGARVWDISKAIDAMSDSVITNVAKINLEDITITGNSGGGTASYYAGCYDERIKVVAPSCGFCNYKDSIVNLYHCTCNVIPGVYEWFDMQDLACLIAPRKLAIIAGATDSIFPLLAKEGQVEIGVEKAFDDTVKKIYADAEAEGNCSLTVTNKGHSWVPNDVWGAIADIRAK